MARWVTLAFGLLAGASFSQIPEFAQQYRQRLGGAIDELATVVARFDADAGAEGLTRAAALDRHLRNADPLFRRRGESAQISIDRLGTLEAQRAALTAPAPFDRLLALTTQADGAIARAAWRDYEPAMPLTTEGVVLGAAGFVSGLSLAAVLGAMMRAWRRARRRAGAAEAKAGNTAL